MLVIRQEQMEAIGKSRLPEFYTLLESYIREEFPQKESELAMPLRQWIEETYAQALLFGIKTKQEHVKYVNYKCIFGDDFVEANEFAHNILTSSASASVKLAELKQAFLEELERKQNA
ncbi:hypothetical protein TDB9533_00517 [Thalassocella blandensis]|nr:hypothetical protein TDB9533_00517 [Thalassocella blandensis]